MIEKKMPENWQARWIDPELPHDKDARQPASVLRRRFSLPLEGKVSPVRKPMSLRQ